MGNQCVFGTFVNCFFNKDLKKKTNRVSFIYVNERRTKERIVLRFA